jgi:hypothetical protein
MGFDAKDDEGVLGRMPVFYRRDIAALQAAGILGF